ncbi:hypothetical protein BC834DRAFT_862123 [Gloeopeniophorella convolvens]|nr:hypothetical protein BC834DRAFT_862123 [Gloeopeniophorella convolvens]
MHRALTYSMSWTAGCAHFFPSIAPACCWRTRVQLCTSYRIVDHCERPVAPHSIAFNMSAERPYSSFKGTVEVFNLTRPGIGKHLARTPLRKSKDELKGAPRIFAVLVFYTAYSTGGAGKKLLAVNVALSNDDTGAWPVAWVGDVRAGMVQLVFKPACSHLLYLSFQRHAGVCLRDLHGQNRFVTREAFEHYGGQ